jgi:hypothetical protein
VSWAPPRIAGLRWTGGGQPCSGGAVLPGRDEDGWFLDSQRLHYPWSDVLVGFRQEWGSAPLRGWATRPGGFELQPERVDEICDAVSKIIRTRPQTVAFGFTPPTQPVGQAIIDVAERMADQPARELRSSLTAGPQGYRFSRTTDWNRPTVAAIVQAGPSYVHRTVDTVSEQDEDGAGDPGAAAASMLTRRRVSASRFKASTMPCAGAPRSSGELPNTQGEPQELSTATRRSSLVYLRPAESRSHSWSGVGSISERVTRSSVVPGARRSAIANSPTSKGLSKSRYTGLDS